jgi:site-specific recombinase XerD
MDEKVITQGSLEDFSRYLIREEKSPATMEKYLRDTRAFLAFAQDRPVSKELVAEYKRTCIDRGYAVRSINSMLASINSLLEFMGWPECKVKNIRMQRQTYCPEDKEMTKSEYLRLLEASSGDERLNLVLQTICGTGIRVSELRHFTLEAVKAGQISVNCKGKIRTILIPKRLRSMLMNFAKSKKITSGPVFVTKSGKPLDRCNIWTQMKRLCDAAGVQPSKVFPHNLRKLFAKTYYAVERDIAKLADILGHSSINTTRIYIMTTGAEHRRQIERLGLVMHPGAMRSHNSGRAWVGPPNR